MAEAKKQRRRIKPAETVREKAAKSIEAKPKRRLRQPKSANTAKARKEFQLPLPDNKAGRFLGRRVRFMPNYFREAWTELRQVTWPSRKETMKLSFAVFTFALIFGGAIWLVDYGLDNLFKKVLIG